MTLADVIAALAAEPETSPRAVTAADPAAVVVRSVAYDSRRVEPGALFCCLRGEVTDGHLHAGAAGAHGAVALLVEHEVDVALPQVVVAEGRPAMARAAAAVYDDPSRALRVVGVTGTNGKTTTTHLLASILEHAGQRAAVLGTLSGERTTPEAPDLQRWFAEQRAAATQVVAMEVSSHALAQHRVDGTHFAVVVFTNLTPEHLDYHGDLEAYFAAKARLFTTPSGAIAVVNRDDPYGRRLIDATPLETVTFSMDDARDLRLRPGSSSFVWRGHEVTVPIGGRFNVANALAAAESARALGVTDADVAAGLCEPVAVPGRFEHVDEGQPFAVIVDYAHTPDALERVLRAARELVAPGGRVRVLFGCGGDRDVEKRPLMGAHAARLADHVVLTSDNSRGESTATIIDAIRVGYAGESAPRSARLDVDEDRAHAIASLLRQAEPGDVVVLAGKGHETTQIAGGREEPFDDREVARAALRALPVGPDGGAAR